MQTKRKYLQAVLNIGLLALALIALVWTGIVSPKAVASAFANPWSALAALVVILAGAQLNVLRWHLLLGWHGNPLSLSQVWRISYISWFLGTFLPGAAGADALRALYVHRACPEKRGVAFITIILDRLLGLAALLVAATGLFALLGGGGLPQTLYLGIGLLLSAAMLTVLAAPFIVVWFNRLLLRLLGRFPRLLRLFREFDDAARLALALWHRQPGKLIACLLLGVAGHALVLAAIVILARSAGLTLSATQLALAGALATLVNQLPLTPGGIGVGELSFAQFCLVMAPGTELSAYGSVMLVFRLLTLISYLPGAPALLTYRPSESARPMASTTASASESSSAG